MTSTRLIKKIASKATEAAYNAYFQEICNVELDLIKRGKSQNLNSIDSIQFAHALRDSANLIAKKIIDRINARRAA